ncbi:60S ribosomal protein L3 [Panus rudis PR-1116 ss-1]|nr:60S ribosomal protein L3 [Panus rudis PR-1116 ss-1]
MGHVQKRLASTAARLAHVSVSSLKEFPPKQAIIPRAHPKPSSSKTPTVTTPSQPHFFHPESWAALQPPAPAALTAFAHRVGLASIIPSNDIIQQACTHPSILTLYQQQRPNEPLPATNKSLEALGNTLLGLFATEYINASYPHLPTRVLKAAVSAYVGPTTCANIAREMGVTPLLRWNRLPNTPTRRALLHADAIASVPRALTALVYQHRSLLSARKFAHKFFLSREVDLRNMIKFRDPKKALAETVAKYGRERPISRLLRETGRMSIAPVYVVGIYSGADQLGEGFGSSLKMAEFRAAEDALLRLYLTRTPPDLVQLPTSTFADGFGDVFTVQGPEQEYVANEMGDSEVLFASAERSGMKVPGARSRQVAEGADVVEL